MELIVDQHVIERIDRRPEEVGLTIEDLAPLGESPRGEYPVQFGDQLGRVGRAGARSVEPVVGQPLRASDRAAQRASAA